MEKAGIPAGFWAAKEGGELAAIGGLNECRWLVIF